MTDQQEYFDSPVSIGALLRRTRELRGESLGDVAHALKLSAHQVDALEREDYDALPGPAFVRGFLRNYARYMQLDLDARIAAIDFGGDARSVKLAAVSNASGEIPSGGIRLRVGRKPVVAVIAGMLIVLGAGWYFDWFNLESGTPVATAPEPVLGSVPARTQAGPAAPLTPPNFLVLPGAEPYPQEDDEPDSETFPLAADEADQSAEPVAEVSEPVTSEPAVAQAAQEPTVATPAPPVATGGGRLTFRLGAESWIQVRDRDGVALFTGTGAPGTTRVVQGNPPFNVVVGNAARVELDLDGRSVDLRPHISSGGVARMTVQ